MIEEITYEALKYASLIWVVFNMLIDLFIKQIKKLPKSLQQLVCLKCLTFWIVLGITFNPFIAAVAAIINYILDNLYPTKL